LGVGKQGRAALYDLAHSQGVTEIIAADREIEALAAHVQAKRYENVHCAFVDADDRASLDRLMARQPDVIVNLLPITAIGNVAAAAVAHGIHLVNTFYATPELVALAGQAEARGITILPELGLDPGIDLVLLGQAVRNVDRVTGITTYGAGVPELAAADNPLRYRVSWTFEGVLKSYHRAGRLIRDGATIKVAADEQFHPDHVYPVDVPGLGTLEAFPNGDALLLAGVLGLDPAELHTLGRYTLRWPGHAAFWRTTAELGLLDDEPIILDGREIDRKHYLATAIEPRLQYAADERDIVIVRVEVSGTRGGREVQLIYTMIDWRDLRTGHTAMSRTVGYTASIGAQMIANGQIRKRGLLSPLTDVPYEPFVRELARRDIQIRSECVDL
jgi:saccharopine dehydrogenase-like NADP-dependent oxidoreductase